MPGPVASPLRPFHHDGGFLQCVPYAREVSGVRIFGDAWTWWDKAEGAYPRGSQPRVGAVLAFGKSRVLRLGHVAVVSRLVGARELTVTHANWGSTKATRGVIHHDQPVIDVSPDNDWTRVRLMNTAGGFGKVYPALGFIYPDDIYPDEAQQAAR
ncbi:CHAP domain-containing protein [Roseospirillum parvum]|uniref:CHAP domain-containing protein n=1 Tax=Roseospirillum parvum TaxID=83401 RepID=UPI001FE09B07|nr:CHAP domain-containing protein [Roseospirillum parvum]